MSDFVLADASGAAMCGEGEKGNLVGGQHFGLQISLSRPCYGRSLFKRKELTPHTYRNHYTHTHTFSEQ